MGLRARHSVVRVGPRSARAAIPLDDCEHHLRLFWVIAGSNPLPPSIKKSGPPIIVREIAAKACRLRYGSACGRLANGQSIASPEE